MKMLKNKKGIVWFSLPGLVLICVLIAFIFGFTGFIKFMVSDKTPFIIVGIIGLILYSKNKN